MGFGVSNSKIWSYGGRESVILNVRPVTLDSRVTGLNFRVMVLKFEISGFSIAVTLTCRAANLKSPNRNSKRVPTRAFLILRIF